MDKQAAFQPNPSTNGGAAKPAQVWTSVEGVNDPASADRAMDGTFAFKDQFREFAKRDLNKALDVPIGLIHSSWGGTVAEAWTPRQELEQHAPFKYLVDNLDKAKQQNKQNAPPNNPNLPTVLYNGMIQPLHPFAFRGAIWYQGESNAGRAYEYRKLFPTMIESWRKAWDLGDFPFLFVQLAPFLPAALRGPRDSFPKGARWLRRVPVRLLLGRPFRLPIPGCRRRFARASECPRAIPGSALLRRISRVPSALPMSLSLAQGAISAHRQ